MNLLTIKPIIITQTAEDYGSFFSVYFQYISTPKWRKLVAAEDYLYNHSIRLIDEAILRVRDEVERGTFKTNKDQFYILSYLMLKPALRWTILLVNIVLNYTSRSIFATLHFLRNLRMGPKSCEVTIHQAGKAFQGQKIQSYKENEVL